MRDGRDGRDGTDGPTEGSTRGPRGPKKNCVVKIAKMAWLDEVSRKERGQDTAKDWKVDVDSDPRMIDVGD